MIQKKYSKSVALLLITLLVAAVIYRYYRSQADESAEPVLIAPLSSHEAKSAGFKKE